MIKVGSLFAGIGGICLGFAEAGFTVVWANEKDNNACKTYRHNFSHRLIEQDVYSINFSELEKVDVVTSGFPCQSFSITGRRGGFEDNRGILFFKTVEAIIALRPRAYFLENVKHLLTHDGGNTFKVIEQAIRDIGYSFIPLNFNVKDYGNIPQNRERVYMV